MYVEMRDVFLTYNNYDKKVNIMTGQEMGDRVKEIIKKYFQDSFVGIRTRHALWSGNSVLIVFALGQKGEWFNGIIHNDPGHHCFWLEGFHNGMISKDEKLQLSVSIGGYLMTKAHTRVPLKFRGKTARPELILKAFDVYFKRMRGVFDENKDQLIESVRGK